MGGRGGPPNPHHPRPSAAHPSTHPLPTHSPPLGSPPLPCAGLWICIGSAVSGLSSPVRTCTEVSAAAAQRRHRTPRDDCMMPLLTCHTCYHPPLSPTHSSLLHSSITHSSLSHRYVSLLTHALQHFVFPGSFSFSWKPYPGQPLGSSIFPIISYHV